MFYVIKSKCFTLNSSCLEKYLLLTEIIDNNYLLTSQIVLLKVSVLAIMRNSRGVSSSFTTTWEKLDNFWMNFLF